MSNTKAPIQNIPLNGPLNLSYNKAEIKPFIGFNKRNAPFLSETLSPIYAKEIPGGTGIYDNDGNFYSVIPGIGNQLTLTKNGTPLVSFSKGSVSKGILTLHTGSVLCLGTHDGKLAVLESSLTGQVLNLYTYLGMYQTGFELPVFSSPVLAYDMCSYGSFLFVGRLYISEGFKCALDIIDTENSTVTRETLDFGWTPTVYHRPILNILHCLDNRYLIGIVDQSEMDVTSANPGRSKEARIYLWNKSDSSLHRMSLLYTDSYATQTPTTYLAKDGFLYQVDDFAGRFTSGYPHTSNFGVPLKAQWTPTDSYISQFILPCTVVDEVTYSSDEGKPAHGWDTYPTPRPTYEVMKNYYRVAIGLKQSTTNTTMEKTATNLTGLSINDVYAVGGVTFVAAATGLYYCKGGLTTFSRFTEINAPIRYVTANYSTVFAVGDDTCWAILKEPIPYTGNYNFIVRQTALPSEIIARSSKYQPLDIKMAGKYAAPVLVATVPGTAGKAYYASSYTGSWTEFDGGASNFVGSAFSNSSFSSDTYGTNYVFMARSGANVVRYTWDGSSFVSPVDCGVQLDYLTYRNILRYVSPDMYYYGSHVLGVNSSGVYSMGTVGGTSFSLVASDSSGATGAGDIIIGSVFQSGIPTYSTPWVFTADHGYVWKYNESPTASGPGNLTSVRWPTTQAGSNVALWTRLDPVHSVRVEYETSFDSARYDISSALVDYGEPASISLCPNPSSIAWYRASPSGLYTKDSLTDPSWFRIDSARWVALAITQYAYSYGASENTVYTTTFKTASSTSSGYAIGMYESTRGLKRCNVGTRRVKDDSGTYAGQIYTGMQIPKGPFKLLYNLSTLSGVSLSASDSSVGALLTSWVSVDPDSQFTPQVVVSGNLSTCFVKLYENENALEFYTYNSEGTPTLQLAFNRYVMIHRAGINCYDTKKLLMHKYASDYNNSIYLGVPFSAPFSSDNQFSQGLVASSQAAQYELEGYPFPSCVLQPQPLYYLALSTSYPISDQFTLSTDDHEVAVYYSSNKTEGTPKYNTSIVASGYVYNPTLAGQDYPLDSSAKLPLQPIPLFFKLVADYSSQAVVILQNSGYPIVYNEKQQPIFLYSQSGQVSDINDGFVISGTLYFIDSNYIYRVSFYNQVVSELVNVAMHSGMVFIGNTTRSAYFYSSLDRTIYEFTGALNLTPVYECSEIESIVAFGYNVATGEVGIATSSKVVIMSGRDIWAVEQPGVDELTVTSSGLVLHTPEKSISLRYYKTSGYAKQPIGLQTQFYGLGNNQVSKMDTFYIRLAVSDPTELEGEVEVSAIVLTDVSTKTSTESKKFKISASDWDKNTNTLYLRYQPRYQTALAMSFDIKSDFAIESLCVSSTPMGVTQVTKNNI